MMPPPRSMLYVSGHHRERIHKALASGADAIVIDLEDSVPASEKGRARSTAVEVLQELSPGGAGPQVWLRVNQHGSPWAEADIAAVASGSSSALAGLRVPKCEDPEVVATIADRAGVPVQLLVESARGLMRIEDLAGAHPGVVGIGLGEADLAADLRVRDPAGLEWARGWVVACARAAGLPSPVLSVYTDVRDLDGLRRDSIRGALTGFMGRSVVHPSQIQTVNEVFTPDEKEVAEARRLVEFATAAAAEGHVSMLDAGGRFVDPAVVEQAKVVLALVRD